MPRNTRENAEERGIPARMDGFVARCGHCGQKLWQVDAVWLKASIAEGASGWRWDGAVWRPTRYHEQQRQRANERLQDGALNSVAREATRERLASNTFRRGDGLADKRRHAADQQPGDVVYRDGVLFTLGDDGAPDLGITTTLRREAGAYHTKTATHIGELSPALSAKLRLPAKVQCPRCRRLNEVRPLP